jgi:hypothetical protein
MSLWPGLIKKMHFIKIIEGPARLGGWTLHWPSCYNQRMFGSVDGCPVDLTTMQRWRPVNF